MIDKSATQSTTQALSLLELDTPLTEAGEDQELGTIYVAMGLHIALFILTVILIGSTSTFSRPTVYTESGRKVFVCLTFLPRFVCTKPRLFLFMIVLPALILTGLFVAVLSLKELHGHMRLIMFVCATFSVVFAIQMFFKAKVDSLAAGVRAIVGPNKNKPNEEDSDDVLELTHLED
jgi:hypothetical protein